MWGEIINKIKCIIRQSMISAVEDKKMKWEGRECHQLRCTIANRWAVKAEQEGNVNKESEHLGSKPACTSVSRGRRKQCRGTRTGMFQNQQGQ